jgi:hypothetical protein
VAIHVRQLEVMLTCSPLAQRRGMLGPGFTVISAQAIGFGEYYVLAWCGRGRQRYASCPHGVVSLIHLITGCWISIYVAVTQSADAKHQSYLDHALVLVSQRL